MKLNKLFESNTQAEIEEKLQALAKQGKHTIKEMIELFFSKIELLGDYDFIAENKSRYCPDGISSSYNGEDVNVSNVTIKSNGIIEIEFTMTNIRYDDDDDDDDDDEDSPPRRYRADDVVWNDTIQHENVDAFMEVLTIFMKEEKIDNAELMKYKNVFCESFGVDW